MIWGDVLAEMKYSMSLCQAIFLQAGLLFMSKALDDLVMMNCKTLEQSRSRFQ